MAVPSYLGFHVVFLAPFLFILLLSVWVRRLRLPRAQVQWAGIVILAAIALTYTIPWEILLIGKGVWSYGEGVVLARFVNIPVEELLFILVQPFITALWLYQFVETTDKMLYVSATPADYERERSERIAEQIVRPTHLVDPVVEVTEAQGQVEDLLDRVDARTERGERCLVTTLTKRMAEDLTEYLEEAGVAVEYMHDETDTLERHELVRGLRKGEFDVLVGINLLREGLDIPEVSLVAILDADQQGFLRSQTTLIQTMGRAARNVNGEVVLYADRMTDAMSGAIPPEPGAVQRRQRPRATDDREGHRRDESPRLEDRHRGCLGARGRRPRRGRRARRTARRADGCGGGQPRVRTRGRHPRSHPDAPGGVRADRGRR